MCCISQDAEGFTGAYGYKCGAGMSKLNQIHTIFYSLSWDSFEVEIYDLYHNVLAFQLPLVCL